MNELTRRDALKLAAGLAIGVALPSIAVADDCVLLDRKDICFCDYGSDGKKSLCRLMCLNSDKTTTTRYIRDSVDDVLDQHINGASGIKVHVLPQVVQFYPLHVKDGFNYMFGEGFSTLRRITAYKHEWIAGKWCYSGYALRGQRLELEFTTTICR